MKNLLIVFLIFCARLLHAQMSFVSESRYITASGYANAYAPPATGSVYSETRVPSVPYGGFSDTVSSNAQSFSPGTGPFGLDVSAIASSSARQQSTITSSQLSVHSHVQSQSSSLLSAWGGDCRGQGISFFEVTFTVPEFLTYELTLDRTRFSHSFPSLESTCSLTPFGESAILNLPLSFFSNGQVFSGTLDPSKTYTLSFFTSTVSTIPDPFGELGSLTADLTFTVVPEPSSLLLLSLAFGGFFIYRLKRS